MEAFESDALFASESKGETIEDLAYVAGHIIGIRCACYLVFREYPVKSSDDGEEVTPVPMPNTEVKLFSADGSWGISPCKSRTLPY